MANKFIFVTILLVKCNLHQSLVNRSTMRFRSTFGLFGLSENDEFSVRPNNPNSSRSHLCQPPMRHSGLRAGVPYEIERVLKLFSPLQFVQLCDSGSEPGMTKKQPLPTLTLPEQGREQ